MEHMNMREQLLQDIRQGRVQPERSGDYWGNDEREELRSLYDAGEGLSQIALQLERSEQAVVQQLIAMDLFTPSGKNRFRTAKAPHCLCSKCQLSESERPCLQEGGVCRNAGTVG